MTCTNLLVTAFRRRPAYPSPAGARALPRRRVARQGDEGSCTHRQGLGHSLVVRREATTAPVNIVVEGAADGKIMPAPARQSPYPGMGITHPP